MVDPATYLVRTRLQPSSVKAVKDERAKPQLLRTIKAPPETELLFLYTGAEIAEANSLVAAAAAEGSLGAAGAAAFIPAGLVLVGLVVVGGIAYGVYRLLEAAANMDPKARWAVSAGTPETSAERHQVAAPAFIDVPSPIGGVQRVPVVSLPRQTPEMLPIGSPERTLPGGRGDPYAPATPKEEDDGYPARPRVGDAAPSREPILAARAPDKRKDEFGRFGAYVDPETCEYVQTGEVVGTDHIVAEQRLRDFLAKEYPKFTKEQVNDIVNLEDNFMGLSHSLNSQKGTKTITEWEKYRDGKGLTNCAEYFEHLKEREREVWKKVFEKIREIVSQNAMSETSEGSKVAPQPSPKP